jgi:uncharacterized protein YdaU (DUF1376 family)
MKWYKRDPHAALEGMAELTMQERGVYNAIIDLLYARDGVVPDDDRIIPRMIACHWRTWRLCKTRLITCGKLWVVDGMLHANRVDEALDEAHSASIAASDRAHRRWQESKKDNDINKNSSNAHMRARNAIHIQKDSKKEKEEVHFKNGNGVKRIEKQKPKHCQKSKNGRIWCDVGTMEFTAYAEDYSQAHLGEAPKLDWNGAGAWFNLSGEPRP